MNFLSNLKFSAVAGILTVLLVSVSCENDVATIGASVIGNDPFTTGQQSYDVFAYNKKIEAVNTNRMPIYQLGTFNDPIYGRTEANITAQLRLSTVNPAFGNYAQATEDNAENDGNNATVQENETVVSVFLNIPYLVSDESLRDSDGDGIDDELEAPADVDDPNSDWDGDTLSDIREKTLGTNPFSDDTDGDGIKDPDDTDMKLNVFPKRFDLDSIYGNRNATVKVNVRRSTYFLRQLDPNANFEEAQEYFSSQEFAPTYVSEVLNAGSGEFVISDMEYIELQDDDPETEANEEGDLKNRYPPGIRIPLKNEFFQQNILDKEGSSELLSQSNFSDFFRGVHLSVESSEDIMFLLDLKQANITIRYTYDSANTDGEAPATPLEKEFELSFLGTSQGSTIGNAVNTFLNEGYPPEIADKMDTGENASKIYLKGGAGSYAEIKLFGEDDVQANAVIEQIRSNNWVINEANLVFYIDQNSVPVGAEEPIRLYVYNADTNEFLFDAATDPVGVTPLSSYLQYDGLLQKESDRGVKYTVRITKYINDIILRDAENATLGVTTTPNINLIGTTTAMLADPNDNEKNIPIASWLTPLGTVLYGSQVSPSNEANKLELEIFYTQSN